MSDEVEEGGSDRRHSRSVRRTFAIGFSRFRLVSVRLSNEVAVRHRVEDGQTNGIHFNSSVRLRLHHSSYLHVTYTLHVARENPIEGNPISTLSKPETYGKCHNIPMLL